MAKVWARVEGGKALERRLRKLGPQLLAELAPFIEQEGRAAFDESQKDVPVGDPRDGHLKDAAKFKFRKTKKSAVAQVRYESAHAAAVHEGVHGEKHVPGTKGFKWLRKVLNRRKKGFYDRAIAKLRALVERG